MATQYRALTNSMLETETPYLRPSQTLPEKVTADSPALEVMTDLTRVGALTISPCASLDDAKERMLATNVRLLLVTNQYNHVIGIVTSRDIEGERPVQYVQQVGGKLGDVMIRDIMTAQHKVEVLKMADVATARVGDIVATLKRMGRQHALVIDHDGSGHQTIRGIFSTSQIGKQLGTTIDTADVAGSFADLGAALG